MRTLGMCYRTLIISLWTGHLKMYIYIYTCCCDCYECTEHGQEQICASSWCERVSSQIRETHCLRRVYKKTEYNKKKLEMCWKWIAHIFSALNGNKTTTMVYTETITRRVPCRECRRNVLAYHRPHIILRIREDEHIRGGGGKTRERRDSKGR